MDPTWHEHDGGLCTESRDAQVWRESGPTSKDGFEQRCRAVADAGLENVWFGLKQAVGCSLEIGLGKSAPSHTNLKLPDAHRPAVGPLVSSGAWVTSRPKARSGLWIPREQVTGQDHMPLKSRPAQWLWLGGRPLRGLLSCSASEPVRHRRPGQGKCG
jgi:hypothetical protein